MPASTDRNLLFGIVALNMDFIDRDHLVAAMHAWLADKARPLGQILEDQKALNRPRRVLLEALVDEHVRRHGDDPARSLAALSSVDDAREALAEIADADVRAGLGRVPSTRLPTGSSLDPGATRYLADTPRPASPRFRVLRAHARGGLGAVFVAQDGELNRRVALKQIQERHADHPGSRARFVLEAEITGGLEHPGIVPVYSLGHDESGRPYYAMRFVQGDNLGDAIAHYHATSGVAPGPRTLELHKLLRRFLDVCEAVAYAHSRGVLHRDLKPGNVMVGRYGETLVVDWGLAKVVGTPETSDEGTLRPSSTDDPATTMPGCPIGTPAYMSPEQAAGDLARLGPASDVYSLGATLYVLLTGRPPVDSGDVPTVLDRVRRGDFPPPRRVAPDVPAALDAICLKAMALKPGDRYPSPLDLAADLEAYLADEPVTAHREPLAARARRWVRRHPRLVTGTAASAMVALVSFAAIAAVVTLANRRLADANGRIRRQRDQLVAASAQIRDQNARIAGQNAKLTVANRDLDLARIEAIRERDQAEALADFFARCLKRADPAQDGRRVTVADALGRSVAELDRREDLDADLRAFLLESAGQAYSGLGLPTEAVAAAERATAIRVAEQGADHPDTLGAQSGLAGAYQALGRTADSIALYERALPAMLAVRGADHPEVLTAQNNLAYAYRLDGRPNDAIPLLERTLEARRRTLGPDHAGTISTQDNLAGAYQKAGRLVEALALFEATLRARLVAPGPDHPLTLTSQNNLAGAYVDASRLDEAATLLERTVESQRGRLGADHPEALLTQSNLAHVYVLAGRVAEGLAIHERTLEARRRRLGAGHPRTLESQGNLAFAYRSAGRLAEAATLYERTLAAERPALGADHPDTLWTQNNLARTYREAGRLDEALALFERTLEARRRKLGADHPATLATQAGLAATHRAAGRLVEAIALFEQTLEASRARLGDGHADTLDVLGRLGPAYEEAARYDDAERIDRELIAAAGRARPRNDRLYVDALTGLATSLMARGEPAAAVAPLREALAIREAKGPGGWLPAVTRGRLGAALLAAGSPAEAEPLLLDAHRALDAQADQIPPALRDRHLRDAVARLIALYEARGDVDRAAAWRRRLPLPDDVFARP